MTILKKVETERVSVHSVLEAFMKLYIGLSLACALLGLVLGFVAVIYRSKLKPLGTVCLLGLGGLDW